MLLKASTFRRNIARRLIAKSLNEDPSFILDTELLIIWRQKDFIISELIDHYSNEAVTRCIAGIIGSIRRGLKCKKMAIGEDRERVGPADVAVIPSQLKHADGAVTACRIIDLFYPM